MKLVYSTVKPIIAKCNLCPVILLHSILDSRKSWKIIAPRIADSTGRVVYFLDARNHGKSSWTEDFTLQLMADDIQEFMSEHEIPKAILVGTGMGGSVAMKLALEAPELIEKLVVEDMVPEPYPRIGWRIVLFAIEMLKKTLQEIPKCPDIFVAKMEITRYLNQRLPIMPPNHNMQFVFEVMPLKEDNGEYKWEANLDAIETALKRTNFDLGLTGTYDGEALFLCGKFSNMNLEDEKIFNWFPRAVRISVPEAAQMRYFNKPEIFVEHMVNFINELSVPESQLRKLSLTASCAEICRATRKFHQSVSLCEL